MGSALKILIVEDDLKIAEMINEFLIGSGHEVCGIARSVAVALDLAKWQSPDIALIDVKLAEGGLGTDVAASLRAISMVGILYAAGDTSPEALRNAIGDACLAKPFRPA